MGAGAIAGMVILGILTIIVLGTIIKNVWHYCRMVLSRLARSLTRYNTCRRENVIVVHRRTTCVRVPILEDDEVQREQERAEQVIPARQPPAYHPRPFQDNPENPALEPAPAYTPTSRINPNQASSSAGSAGNNHNTNNIDGAQQDYRMVPPPEVFQWHSASSGQRTNPFQTDQPSEMTNEWCITRFL